MAPPCSKSFGRLAGAGEKIDFAPPVAGAGRDFRFVIAEQAAPAGIGSVLIGPERCDTAPHVRRGNPEAVLVVAPFGPALPDVTPSAPRLSARRPRSPRGVWTPSGSQPGGQRPAMATPTSRTGRISMALFSPRIYRAAGRPGPRLRGAVRPSRSGRWKCSLSVL